MYDYRTTNTMAIEYGALACTDNVPYVYHSCIIFRHWTIIEYFASTNPVPSSGSGPVPVWYPSRKTAPLWFLKKKNFEKFFDKKKSKKWGCFPLGGARLILDWY